MASRYGLGATTSIQSLQHDETRPESVGSFLPFLLPQRRTLLIQNGKGPEGSGPFLWIK
jgi:hypothetical protein